MGLYFLYRFTSKQRLIQLRYYYVVLLCEVILECDGLLASPFHSLRKGRQRGHVEHHFFDQMISASSGGNSFIQKFSFNSFLIPSNLSHLSPTSSCRRYNDRMRNSFWSV